MPNLTPWFPGDVQPARVGAYQLDIAGPKQWACWNGFTWLKPAASAEKAMANSFQGPQYVDNRHSRPRWRGLAQESKHA